MRLLNEKVVLVTGAGRGIGRKIAEKFAKEGAIVYINDLNEQDLKWSEEYLAEGMYLYPLPFDVCDFQLTKNRILYIWKKQGKFDVLVNNAGLISYELLHMIDFSQLRKMFEVNVLALIHLLQLASKLMMRQRSGSIINMASIVGIKGAKGQLAYSATKGAVVSVTKSASKELSEYGIRVNAVAPGMVATERFKDVVEKKFANKVPDIGLGRMATPEEIAEVYLFLASDMSNYITGQVINVDGGLKL